MNDKQNEDADWLISAFEGLCKQLEDSGSKSEAQIEAELQAAKATVKSAPPGAPSPVKLRQTHPRDAFRRRTKSKYRKRYKTCLRIGSYGVAIGPHCVAKLYKGELQ